MPEMFELNATFGEVTPVRRLHAHYERNKTKFLVQRRDKTVTENTTMCLCEYSRS